MALSRPLPPHRKRIPSITPRTAPNLTTEDNAWDSLRDKSDDQLRAITRNDLVQALRGEWNLKDKVDPLNIHRVPRNSLMVSLDLQMVGKIEMLENNRDKLERDIGELSRAMATLQSRFDESLNEQAS